MLSVAAMEAQNPEPTSASPTSLVLPHKQTQETHVFVSMLPTIPISNHLPLHIYFLENVAQYSNRACLIMGKIKEIYTFVETHLICRRVAIGLSRIRVGKGDVVMALLQNCVEFVFTFMGASMIGAMTTTTNPFCTMKEIFKQFSASRSKVIGTQSQYVDKLRDVGDDSVVFCDDFKVGAIESPLEGCLPFTVLSKCDEAELTEI